MSEKAVASVAEKPKKKRRNNPNNANQYNPDPRQSLFLEQYLDPESPTFSNAKQTALAVGYSEEYADNLMSLMPSWLSDSIGDNEMLSKAESVLRDTLGLNAVDEEGKDDAGLHRVRLDAAKFVAKGLGKDKWSERKEHTGANGGPILQFIVSKDITGKHGLERKPASGDTTVPKAA
jgi:hypothetical protein